MKGAQLVLAMAFLLAACRATPPPSLPTLAEDTQVCAGVGNDGTLTGNPRDPRVAWLAGPHGERTEIVWPPGFTARFDPDLAVLDASGQVVYRAGDQPGGGCVIGASGSPLLILPPS
jgi:hypothetical protein